MQDVLAEPSAVCGGEPARVSPDGRTGATQQEIYHRRDIPVSRRTFSRIHGERSPFPLCRLIAERVRRTHFDYWR